jgi:hypothetical protein
VKTADVNIRITPKLKEAARKAAQLDQRTLSSLIERLLTEHCQKVGTLKRRPWAAGRTCSRFWASPGLLPARDSLLSAPILFGFSLHRRMLWVLVLDPVPW